VSGFAIGELVVDEGGKDIGRHIGYHTNVSRPQLLPRFSTAGRGWLYPGGPCRSGRTMAVRIFVSHDHAHRNKSC
jgi:hypothetical protein